MKKKTVTLLQSQNFAQKLFANPGKLFYDWNCLEFKLVKGKAFLKRMIEGKSSFDPTDVLNVVWGYSSFRPLQKEAVDAVLSGNDALVVLPTGGGKSLCYQLPAACGIGLVLVISPLIALMDDQVAAATEFGISAAALHSHIDASSRRRTWARLHSGDIKLLYVSPERLVGSFKTEGENAFFDLLEKNLGLLAIDEAHCVSHWGHEFRPEYRQLEAVFSRLKNVPRLALTATATPVVQTDIIKQLGLRDSLKFIGFPDRPNLRYRAFPRYDQLGQVLDVIRRHPGQGGIVYAQTRKEVERLARSLAKAGISCAPYHAGLEPEQRAVAQESFIHERLDVIVATIAFGMGIDRSNVRFVVHANSPKSIEHYQQESGRAGRDGEPADCVLLFSAGDLMTHRALSFKDPGMTVDRKVAVDRQLKDIGRFAISPVCRHRLLCEHFGQTYLENGAGNNNGCGACDVCLGETEALPDDEALLIAQKIISAAYRTENRFGAGYVIHVLLGKDGSQRIRSNGHDKLKVFGLMKEHTENALRAWVDQLVVQGYLQITESEYPLLQTTRSGLELCKGIGNVRLGRSIPSRPKVKRARSPVGITIAAGSDAVLFEKLRKLRLLLARKKNVPPYVVFPDSALTEMAGIKPKTLDEFRTIKGVGDSKLEKYGNQFLQVIAGESPESVS